MRFWNNTKRLGKLQRRLLLWIFWSTKSGVSAREIADEKVIAREIADEKDDIRKATGRRLRKTREEAQALPPRPPALQEDLHASLGGRIALQWSAERFLRHSPSDSESATLSEALRKLEERRLITRIHRGTAEVATHVRLTMLGQAYAVQYLSAWTQHFLEEAPIPPGGVPEPESDS